MTNSNISNQDEIWKPICGYEGYYEVSNMGRVRSLDRTIYRETPWKSFSFYSYKGTILSQCENKKGYLSVVLCKNDKPKTIRVNRLVATHFIENQQGKPQVNHLDGEKKNNKASNLEWSTNGENGKHSFRFLGRRQSGAQKRPVASYLNGVEVNRYPCINSVTKDGNTTSGVVACLSGKQKTHRGLIWKSLTNMEKQRSGMKNILLSITLLILSISSTFAATTTHYSLNKPTVGGSPNIWGGLLNTNVDTIDSALWSLGAGVNKGVNSSLANASNVTLTNPVVATQLIGFTAPGKKLILPAMNAATSPQVGAVLHVINGALETYDVVAADGSTSVVASLLAGKDVYIEITSNATSNGSFRTYSYGDLSSTTAAATYAPINNAALTGSTTAQSLLVSGTSTVSTLSITGTGTAVTRSPGDNSTKIATTAYVDATLLGVFPSGIIAPYAGSSAPDGWMFCYGQAVDRTTYASLFTAIGTTYGSGDGSTTFNLPDLRGRVIAGKDNMGGTSSNRLTGVTGGVDGDTLGNSGGEEAHELTVGELPSHRHVGGAGVSGAQANYGYIDDPLNLRPSPGSNTDASLPYTSYVGGDAAHNNVQPTLVLTYIIKY